MPEPEPLFVDFEALDRRAKEIQEPLPAPPTTQTKAPCTIDLVVDSTRNLQWSLDEMRTQLQDYQDVLRLLGIAVRNVAQTYRMIDHEGAQAISDNTSVSGAGGMAMLGSMARDSDSATLGSAPSGMLGDVDPGPVPGMFTDVETRARQLEGGDGGKTFLTVSTEWTSYADVLLKAKRRFRKFTDEEWRGRWRDDVNNSFAQQVQWLDDMSEACYTIAKAAKDVATAHNVAIRDHVWGHYKSTTINTKFDYAMLKKVETDWAKDAHSGYEGYMKFFQEVQANSDAIWAKYQSSGHLPIQKMKAPAAVKAITIPNPWNKPAKPPNWDDYEMDAKHQKNLKPPPRPDLPEPKPKPTPKPQPDGGFDGLPMMPSSPSMPTMPKDHPNQGDPNLADALASALDKGAKTPSMPHGGAGGGIKPAAAMPLQPFTDDAPRPAPAAGGGSAGPRGGVPGGAGGAMGGGMGGGAPAQGGKDGGKGKRVQGEDEALYTEEREWTEGLIGRRRVKEN